MLPGKTKPGNAKPQAERFVDKARELGCDEDEITFEDKLRRIVPKPKPKEEPSERS